MKTIAASIAAAAIFAAAGAAHAQSVRDACASDYQKVCSGMLPGGSRIAKCFVAHKDQLTDGCKTALLTEAAKKKADAK
jgi:hypothetical protein